MTAYDVRFCERCGRMRGLHDHEPSLFDGPYTGYDGTPPHERVSTSEAAATSVLPTVNTLQERVYRAIRVAPNGMTDDDVEAVLQLRHQTVSARRRELYLRGLIVSNGERLTRSGRRAKVWVVK